MAIRKPVSFKDSEIEMIKYVETKISFTIYVKELIAKDMKENNKPTSTQKNEFELDF